MLRNYLVTAFRNLRRNKAYSAINIVGLSVGLACAFFIVLWVQDEMRFDRFHEQSDRIYRVMRHATFGGVRGTTPAMPKPLDDVLDTEYPEIANSVLMDWGSERVVSLGEVSFRANGRYFDPDVFEVFTHPFLLGDPVTALQDPESVTISESLASRLFGAEWRTRPDVLGTQLRLDNRMDARLTGVFEDVPKNSSVEFDFVTPMQEYIRRNDWVENWGNNGLRMWVRLRPDADVDVVNAKLKDLIDDHNDLWESDVWLQPLPDVYLKSKYEDGHYVGGRIDYVRIFGLVAVFILLIAGINFMNLATARSARRGREIGVRKAVGATRAHLAGQFLGESMLTAAAAFVFAVALVLVLLGFFNDLTGKAVSLSHLTAQTWAVFAGTALLTGLFAGTYPALYLSSISTVRVLRANQSSTAKGGGLRKALVVIQFAVSIVLIVGTLTVYRQITYIRTTDLGMSRENVVYVPIEGAIRDRFEVFKAELLREPGIVSVSSASSNPLQIGQDTMDPEWDGKPEGDNTLFSIISSGYDFLETMKIELLAGRDFSPEFGADSSNFVINQKAAAAMGFEDPIGQRLSMWGREGTIVGLVRDFHTQSLYADIQPAIIRLVPEDAWLLFVRIAPGETPTALAGIERLHGRLNPEYPFKFTFLDTEFERAYRNEIVIGRLANVFAFMAVFIACLGLFGLASFTAEQRTKEIGIRKVLGASNRTVVMLLSREFVALVVLAFLIAAPSSWYLMNRWLSAFTFHVEFGIGILAAAGLTAVAIAWLTVSWQSYRAALADPVLAIRS